jgi:hypothetical protein
MSENPHQPTLWELPKPVLFQYNIGYLRYRLTMHRKAIPETGDAKADYRQAIIDGHCDCVLLGRGPDGKLVSYADFFERLFGEPLYPKAKRGRK